MKEKYWWGGCQELLKLAYYRYIFFLGGKEFYYFDGILFDIDLIGIRLKFFNRILMENKNPCNILTKYHFTLCLSHSVNLSYSCSVLQA